MDKENAGDPEVVLMIAIQTKHQEKEQNANGCETVGGGPVKPERVSKGKKGRKKGHQERMPEKLPNVMRL